MEEKKDTMPSKNSDTQTTKKDSDNNHKKNSKTDMSAALENMSKEELIDKLKETEKSAQENFDMYIRCKAEMENFKKRVQKEKQDMIKYSNESLIKELLSVVDNLEKALEVSKEKHSLDILQEGIELTLKGFKDILKKAGIECVEAVGKPFDPNFHEAVSIVTDDSAEHNTVQEELQKGYMLNGRLIRPAMVVVNKKNDN
ncbi:MAG: nucleotide exchange factor GrpE [Deltaproteobacteria bacterium]|nr:nucleotide exchange factor GrpE [Deltaproteobacteria bacterium]